MRSKSNLQKFSHAEKSSAQKRIYQDRLGSSIPDDSVLDEDFKETSNPDEISDNAEEVSEPYKPPFKSWWTRTQEHSFKILGLIVFGLASWLLLSAVNNGKDISGLRENYGTLKENVMSLQDKYEKINEKTIRSDVLLEEIQKDLTSISQQMNK